MVGNSGAPSGAQGNEATKTAGAAGAELVTQAEHARRCGVSRKSVTAWKAGGQLVMVGELVDHARSYKGERWHAGVKKAHAGAQADASGAGGRQPRPRGRPATTPATMTAGDVLVRLKALDWVAKPDWSPAVQLERARQAARCVGLEALESNLCDDGHHGGFQLRDPKQAGVPLADGHIFAGFGFELRPWQVLDECRRWATGVPPLGGEPLFDLDHEVEVIPSLLPLLALPFLSGQTKEPAR